MEVFTEEIMCPLFTILERTRGVEQRADYHPEGDVLNHSLQTMYCAFKETIDTDLILAAMMHDVGKALEKDGHAEIAFELLQPFLSAKSLWLIRHHMRVRLFLDGHMKRKSKIDYLLENAWFTDLVLLSRFDLMGRDPNETVDLDREKITERLNRYVDLKFEANKLRAETEDKFKEGLNKY